MFWLSVSVCSSEVHVFFDTLTHCYPIRDVTCVKPSDRNPIMSYASIRDSIVKREDNVNKHQIDTSYTAPRLQGTRRQGSS